MATTEKAIIQDVSTKEKRGLVVKLCEIMAAIGWVEKKGRNEFHKYDYATEADLVEAVRGHLAERHVFIFPNVRSHSRSSEGITDIMVEWTFVDGETGETYTCNIPGAGQDKGDKGVYKALTGSEKYLLMKTFLIPTGDDPEGDEKVDREQGKNAAKEVAVSKLKKAANGDESLYLTPWKEGRLALSGNGVAIIRAALSDQEKNALGIMLDAKERVFHMPAAYGFSLVDACKKHNVPTVWTEKAAGPIRAIIPDPKSDDPKIEAASIVKAGGKVKKPFLSVKWDGKKLTCFEVVNKQDMKPLWDLVLANVGKPADFLYEQHDQYYNITGIKRLNGHDYEAEQAALDSGSLEPEPENLEPDDDPRAGLPEAWR